MISLKIYKKRPPSRNFFRLMGHYINKSCIFVTCTTGSRTYCIQRKNIEREAALHRCRTETQPKLSTRNALPPPFHLPRNILPQGTPQACP